MSTTDAAPTRVDDLAIGSLIVAVIGIALTVIYLLAFLAVAAFVGYSYWFLGGIPGLRS